MSRYMVSKNVRACALVSATLAGWFVAGPALGSDEAAIQLGRMLFVREWEPNDSLSRKGDGLGPMFNATSCAACHHQGGIGGGGGNEHNVDLLTLVDPSPADRKKLQLSLGVLKRIHPGFQNSTSLVIHKHLVSDNREPQDSSEEALLFSKPTGPDYAKYRSNLLIGEPQFGIRPVTSNDLPGIATKNARRLRTHGYPIRGLKASAERGLIHIRSVSFKWTQRNTPSLHGLGLLDSIPLEERERIAKDQASRNGVIQGRVAGAFGWRGQTAKLKDFVLGACANELGLQTRGNPQAPSPWDRRRGSKGQDMDQLMVDRLASFVASLPPPKRLPSQSEDESWARAVGKDLFHQAECHVCHVSNLKTVSGDYIEGVYSDLLTHDMGESLAEPVAALSSSAAYNGGIQQRILSPGQFAEASRRWKTPPLWGVRDTAPYLHDGRAPTLDEAIRQHDGEARYAREVYLRLKDQEQENLLVFVRSLGSP